METTIVYWGYIGMMGKKMKTTIFILVVVMFLVLHVLHVILAPAVRNTWS